MITEKSISQVCLDITRRVQLTVNWFKHIATLAGKIVKYSAREAYLVCSLKINILIDFLL